MRRSALPSVLVAAAVLVAASTAAGPEVAVTGPTVPQELEPLLEEAETLVEGNRKLAQVMVDKIYSLVPRKIPLPVL